MYVLHHEPIMRLAVLAVDARCFDELGFELIDGFGLVVAMEVADECIHLETGVE